MSNTVEIVITAKNLAKPAFAAVHRDAMALNRHLEGLSGRVRVAYTRDWKAVEVAAESSAATVRRRVTAEFDGMSKDTSRKLAAGGWAAANSFGKTASVGFSSFGAKATAAIAAGLPAIVASAGTLGAATAGAFGTGLAGLGIAAAAQSGRVKNEFASMKRDVLADLLSISGPFERTLIGVADTARTTMAGLKPYLAGAFDTMAPAVARFTASIGQGVASLGPALQPLSRGFSAVLDAIGDRAPEIFGNIESALQNLAVTAELNADDLASAIEFVTGAFEGLTSATSYLAAEWDGFVAQVEAFTGSIDEGWIDAWTKGQDAYNGVIQEYATAAERAASSTRGIGDAAEDAATGVGNLKEEFEELSGALNADEAASQYQEALDKITESLKKNGRTIDIHTEKGRANRDALRDIAKAAQTHLIRMGEEGRTVDEVSRRYLTYRSQLIGALQDAGKTRGQATRLANAWLSMPRSVNTHLKANVKDLDTKIAAAKYRLKDPALTRPEKAKIRADINDLLAAKRRAQAALNSIRDKVVRVTVAYSSSGRSIVGGTKSVGAYDRAHGGIIGGASAFASGGISGAGGSVALVGEQGPELVRLPFGSNVVPAGTTRAMMNPATSGFNSVSMAFRQSGGASGGSDGVTAVKDLTRALKELREVITLRQGMEAKTSGAFGQERALSAYEAAWDTARTSLKKNGKRLSLGTEKGRENRGALLSLAEAAQEVVAAMAERGRSITSVTKKMAEQRLEFLRIARAMGLTAKQAKALADRYGLIPKKVKTILTEERKDTAYNRKVTAYNRRAEAYNTKLEKAQGKASGGIAGGWTLVGERGAELVRLPYGSSVAPHGQTQAMLSGGARPSAGPMHITLQIGSTTLGEIIIDPLRKAVRTRGGNVQAVLGRA